MEKVQIHLPVIFPNAEKKDACFPSLVERLHNIRGVEKAHVIEEKEPKLCLHYDSNFVSLQRVERLAKDVGAKFLERYRHDKIPIYSLGSADSAEILQQSLEQIDGVLHASVSYTTKLVLIAYDSQKVSSEQIHQKIKAMGRNIAREKKRKGEHPEHDHGHPPSFLPKWVQHHWSAILVVASGLFWLVGLLLSYWPQVPYSVVLSCYLISYFAGGYEVAFHAIPELLRGKFDTDVLMLAAALGAAILGKWAEGAFLLFLFSLGHAGEHYALDRARNAVHSLGEWLPKTAWVKRNGKLVEENREELQLEDVVVIRPGDRIPIDGKIISGEGEIDQSPITGESVPVFRQQGDEVFAGTINQNSSLEVEVTKLAEDNTLNRVMSLVEEAQSQRSPTQQFTQKFMHHFVPLVLGATLLVAVIPPLGSWLSWQESFYRAMSLLVACSPCALALGTPAAILAGIAQAARNGVLIKGGVYLESMGKLKTIAFDKTGTLTEGHFYLTDVVPLQANTEEQVLQLAASVEQQSNHPLAEAIVEAAKEKGLELAIPAQLENIAGKGIKGRIGDKMVTIGTRKLFAEKQLQQNSQLLQKWQQLEENGKTVMAVQQGETFQGLIALADQARHNALSTMQRLQKIGVKHLIMLTGDNEQVARRIAQETGITELRANLLPEQKLAAIKEIKNREQIVAMVGDGVNDAPALVHADVGVAMGGVGTGVALETADVALMADDLSKLPFAIGLSRFCKKIIQQNLVIALGVIALLGLVSLTGYAQLSAVVFFHEGSTIVVVVNALRLLGYEDKER